MKVILETERLFLREMTPGDAEVLWELNSDEDVIRYTGDNSFISVDAARVFLENYQDYKVNGMGRWAVIDKETNTFLGWCGLKLDDGINDLGYRFFKKHWGKGYATESAKACLDYGFQTLGLKEIIGRVDQMNTASIKVLEKIGMEYWKKDSCKWIQEAFFYRLSR